MDPRVDLRSDTVTRPTSAMRAAMAEAEVGDDVLQDDPTVMRLEDRMANLLGKEAGLFVPSGTMSNAVAIRTHTSPGDEVVLESTSHIYVYEGGGFAAMSGCSVALVEGEHGLMRAEQVNAAIRKQEGSLGHYPDATLVCVENTSNRGGGTCYDPEVLTEIGAIAGARGCAYHMDGARLFNAAIATDCDARTLVASLDTVSVCLSKGLGAPVGSVLVGSKAFITRAHRWRKMFGGGMRQSGLLAAAGLHAIDHHIDRLAEDHRRARWFAEEVASMDGFEVDLDAVQTNIVYVTTARPDTEVVDALADAGIDVFTIGSTGHCIRVVTHLDVDDEGISRAVHAFRALA